jgi:hypothetical protein
MNMQNHSGTIMECLAGYNGLRAAEGNCPYFVANDEECGTFLKCNKGIEVYCHQCEGTGSFP